MGNLSQSKWVFFPIQNGTLAPRIFMSSVGRVVEIVNENGFSRKFVSAERIQLHKERKGLRRIMADEKFDAFTKLAAKAVTRRQTLLGLAAGVGSAILTVFRGSASAEPQTCVTCTCGTGRPCNPRSTTCAEVRGFPAEQTCEEACAKRGQNLCSAGVAYHCPRGCPA